MDSCKKRKLIIVKNSEKIVEKNKNSIELKNINFSTMLTAFKRETPLMTQQSSIASWSMDWIGPEFAAAAKKSEILRQAALTNGNINQLVAKKDAGKSGK